MNRILVFAFPITVFLLAVLEYIKSTWPEDVRALQQQQTLQNTSS